MEAADYAKKLIAAYRASGGGYVNVARLITASGLTQAQAQAAFDILAGAQGKANGWTVYTELPLSRGGGVQLTCLFRQHGEK